MLRLIWSEWSALTFYSPSNAETLSTEQSDPCKSSRVHSLHSLKQNHKLRQLRWGSKLGKLTLRIWFSFPFPKSEKSEKINASDERSVESYQHISIKIPQGHQSKWVCAKWSNHAGIFFQQQLCESLGNGRRQSEVDWGSVFTHFHTAVKLCWPWTCCKHHR